VIQFSKETDERRDAGPLECWCLHGAAGLAADWRGLAKNLAASGIGSRAVDLWRFLECCPLPLPEFGRALNADAGGQVFRGSGRGLLGYSMGGRMALHALLEKDHPWQVAVIVSAHPGLEDDEDRIARRRADAEWASQALTGNWREFMEAWNAQPLLGNSLSREPHAVSALMQRRWEVARSFVDWSLGAQESLWQRLGEISIPVLWVAGENDLKFRALAGRACGLMPHGALAVAPGAGHRVPWEAEAWFAAQVSKFLKLGHV
jgi:2-succinyl-6-hydroxy-2,4-cyclohexadiene-1-carboxylate synthase